jgi:hypothetical protein
LPGLVALAVVVIRPQTAVALFVCYLTYPKRGFVTRLIWLVPALAGLRTLDLPARFADPLWNYVRYGNSILPPIRYPLALFGPLFPLFLFAFAAPELLLSLMGPLITFYGFSCVALQPELRFSFFALVAVVVPLFVAIALAALHRFGRRFDSDEIGGLVNAVMLFLVLVMSLSSLAGLWARLGQKFAAWNGDAVALGRWIAANTPREAVFANDKQAKWNPAVFLAGRLLFIAPQSALHSVVFRVGDRAAQLQTFLAGTGPVPPVDYFVAERGSAFAAALAPMVGKVVEAVYENDGYQVFARVGPDGEPEFVVQN